MVSHSQTNRPIFSGQSVSVYSSQIFLLQELFFQIHMVVIFEQSFSSGKFAQGQVFVKSIVKAVLELESLEFELDELEFES